MSWKPRKCVIALLTLAALACFAALIAVNIKPQHDAYPSSLSIKKGQDSASAETSIILTS